ncbi:MAG: hypothetical protein K2X82_26980 [Gemmataceae bacterium]|nr:hypothetical protein [Gemmataceae bacterium]
MEADVRSIDAVRDWRAALCAYGESLSEALAGVELEIRRGFDWLADQLARWRREVRECEEDVFRAKQELAARKWPGYDDRPPDTTDQEKALRRAEARLEYAEGQVERVRGWIARLPKVVDEVYRGKGRRLVAFLEVDLPRGLADLDRRVSALDRYAGLRPDYAPTPTGSTSRPHPPAPSTTKDPSPRPPPLRREGEEGEETPPPNPLPRGERGESEEDPSPGPSPLGGGEKDGRLGSSSPSPPRGGGRGEGSGETPP